MENELIAFLKEIYEDGTLAQMLTSEELTEELLDHPKAPACLSRFLGTEDEQLNELTPAEVLASHAAEARTEFAAQLEKGEVTSQFAHRYTGPGYTDGIHTSQQRLFDMSTEERFAKVLHAAKSFDVEDDSDAPDLHSVNGH